MRNSIETWSGAPSNSKVCTAKSFSRTVWKVPWKAYSVPSGSRWTIRHPPWVLKSNSGISTSSRSGPIHRLTLSGSRWASNTAATGASKSRSVSM